MNEHRDQDYEFETSQPTEGLVIPFGRDGEKCEFSLVISRKKFGENRYGMAVVRLVITRKNSNSPRSFYLPIQSLDEMKSVSMVISELSSLAEVTFKECKKLNKNRQDSIESDRTARIEEHKQVIASLGKNKNATAGRGLSQYSSKSKTAEKKKRSKSDDNPA